MRIIVKPSDLLKRCLWDNYVYYIIGSEKEAEKLFKEDLEFEISERDALVIGLLKCIETDNLIHKFNTYVVDFLTNKSTSNQKGQILVRKKAFDLALEKFMEKFPNYWQPDVLYKKAFDDLKGYFEEFREDLKKVEIQKITDQFGTYEFYNSNGIKKLLSFNY